MQILCGEPVARAEIEAATRALDIPFALFVAPEIWLAAVQQAIYGRPMEPRLVRLFARVVGAEPVRRWQAAHTPVPPPTPPEPPVEFQPRLPPPLPEVRRAESATAPPSVLSPPAPPPEPSPPPSPHDKGDVPGLIERLEEADDAEAAHAALVAITKQDFGSKPKRWAAWWKQHEDDDRIDWLFEGLSHKTAEIREAAEQELRALTGEYFGYAFDLPRGAREAARARWQSWWTERPNEVPRLSAGTHRRGDVLDSAPNVRDAYEGVPQRQAALSGARRAGRGDRRRGAQGRPHGAARGRRRLRRRPGLL